MTKYFNPRIIQSGTLSNDDFDMAYTSLSDISEQIEKEERFLQYLKKLAAEKVQGKEKQDEKSTTQNL